MPEHIEVTVAGVTYNNVRQAWRELSPDGLPEITVRKRLDAGWPTLVAFTLAPLPPELRRLGHEADETGLDATFDKEGAPF